MDIASMLSYGKCSYCVRNFNPPRREEINCKLCGCVITADEDMDNGKLCDHCCLQKEIDAKDETTSRTFNDDSKQA